MPRMDGTGPTGQGPGTGRGMGPCGSSSGTGMKPTNNQAAGWLGTILGAFGLGSRARRGTGRGMGVGQGAGRGGRRTL